MKSPNFVQRFAVVHALRLPASVADEEHDHGHDFPPVVEGASAVADAWEVDLDESSH